MRRAVGGVLVALLWVATGCSSGNDDGGATARPPQQTPVAPPPPEVVSFTAALAALPVEADGTASSETPLQPFDCQAIAEELAASTTDPIGLLAAAAEAGAEVETLVSSAQINVADGLAACARGDMASAARFFDAAAEARELLEDL